MVRKALLAASQGSTSPSKALGSASPISVAEHPLSKIPRCRRVRCGSQCLWCLFVGYAIAFFTLGSTAYAHGFEDATVPMSLIVGTIVVLLGPTPVRDSV